MAQSEKKNDTDSARNSSARQVAVLEDDYAVRSRIANSRSMLNVEEYPVIERTVFDPVHLDPDESEYCPAVSVEAEEYQAAVDEGYALHRRRKSGYD